MLRVNSLYTACRRTHAFTQEHRKSVKANQFGYNKKSDLMLTRCATAVVVAVPKFDAPMRMTA